MLKEKNKTADICNTIHSADKIDPFEGLDLGEICVSPKNLKKPSSTNKKGTNTSRELFDLNPLDGINLDDISVNTTKAPPPSEASEKKDTTKKEDVNFVILPSKGSEEADKQKHLEKQAFEKAKKPLSTNISQPPTIQAPSAINPIVTKAYHYAELNQIREKISSSLENSGGNTLLLASPLDNTGTTLLAAALGYNTACSCQKHVLLIDCNMRRAGLHSFFYLPQSYGFSNLIKDKLPWQAVVKETGIDQLSVITAGDPCENFSEYIRYSDITNLMKKIKNNYDLIIFDTSPILKPNRNNVNIVSLTSVADYFLLITKQSGTTKDHLREVQTIIEAGNGKIDGIVLNEHSPEKKPTPFSK